MLGRLPSGRRPAPIFTHRRSFGVSGLPLDLIRRFIPRLLSAPRANLWTVLRREQTPDSERKLSVRPEAGTGTLAPYVDQAILRVVPRAPPTASPSSGSSPETEAATAPVAPRRGRRA